MSNKKYNVIIVGSGFAGISAANHLAQHNLSILLMDENIHIGGQLLRKIPPVLGIHRAYHPDSVKRQGFRFVEAVQKNSIDILNKARVLGVYGNRQILVELVDRGVMAFDFDLILFATGARERFIPFRGWTLPGVYSTGMAQVMMKSSGVLCAEKMVIAGSGLFLLAVGYEYIRNGGKLLALFEQSPMLKQLRFLPLLPYQFGKFWEGGKYIMRLLLSRVPPSYRYRVVEARGKSRMEEVIVAKVDANGRMKTGSEKIIPTDALASGDGFVANIELPQLAGCDLRFDSSLGGWLVAVDDNLKTSLPDVYAAGEITGVGGAPKSITEGEMAAYGILNTFGILSDETYKLRMYKLKKDRGHHLQFAKLFNSLYETPETVIEDIPDDTVICRCEDVTYGEIKQAVRNGFTTPSSLKIAIRTGMGNCQGRTCGPLLYRILSILSEKNQKDIGPLSVRPPIKPTSIQSLITPSPVPQKQNTDSS